MSSGRRGACNPVREEGLPSSGGPRGLLSGKVDGVPALLGVVEYVLSEGPAAPLVGDGGVRDVVRVVSLLRPLPPAAVSSMVD